MPIQLIYGICLLLQGAAMAVDELHFHRARGLPQWERVGHPLDSLTVLGVLGSFSVLPKAAVFPPWLIGTMLFSCLFVTKDEWVHKRRCTGNEQWLHSVLLVLHPCVLISAGLTWKESGPTALNHLAVLAIFVCFVFQVVYWNVLSPDRRSVS